MKGALISAAAMLAMGPIGAGAVPVVLDFDSAPQNWVNLVNISVTPVIEDGFLIEGIGASATLGVGDSGWCSPACSSNGTKTLRSSSAGTVTSIQRQDALTFDFLGFDAAEFYTGSPHHWATSITATGVRADAT